MVDSKTEVIAKIISDNYNKQINNILVVGCGSGIEAGILAQELSANVIGIDIIDNFDFDASRYAMLRKGDAMALEFGDASFDFIYSYHALEHIQNPIRALNEMNRVLVNGGGYWIGTPNRLRVIGYLGSKNTSWKKKVQWNINDWKAKITGTFRNELGAHAGYSSKELQSLVREVFRGSRDMTRDYYLTLYKNHEKLLKLIIRLKAGHFLFPSIYYMGNK